MSHPPLPGAPAPTAVLAPGTVAPTPTQTLDTDAAVLRLDQVLRFAAARSVSDIHLKPGQRPLYRRFGVLSSRRDEPVLTEDELVRVALHWLPVEQRTTLQSLGEARFCVGLVGCGRFRVTAVRHRGGLSMAVRPLPNRVLSPRELGLPKLLQSWAALPSGLIVVASAPGGGRTWTLAALLEQINTAAPAPRTVTTLEHPVELLLDDKAALVCQRELGVDVPDLKTGIATALRADTDVIAVADPAPADLPLLIAAAEQGRLVFASVAAPGVVAALQRWLEAAPAAEQPALRARFARHFRGGVATAMLASGDGKGLVAAAEVIAPIRPVLDAMRAGDWDGLQAVVDLPHSRSAGLCSLDTHLLEMATAGQISLDQAIAAARDGEGLRAKVTGVRGNRPPTTAPLPAVSGPMPGGASGYFAAVVPPPPRES